ncbi:hypothetical protein WNY78_14910 [Psychroserpens sp. AS72]|uniref:hypothetical protein n=1 Tax=Psychroserpens sp. AS72 TaxID=3135775 RepID=UPI0031822997
MNKIFITLIAVLALAVNLSCGNDDLNATTSSQTLNGLWNLTSIEGGFADVNYQFDVGEITWNFNLETNLLNVVNNNLEDIASDGLETGEYNFSIVEFDDILLLEINNDSFGSYFIQNNELIIDQNGETSGNSDGFILGFRR